MSTISVEIQDCTEHTPPNVVIECKEPMHPTVITAALVEGASAMLFAAVEVMRDARPNADGPSIDELRGLLIDQLQRGHRDIEARCVFSKAPRRA